MGKYQTYKGNPENKLFYIIEGLIGGINTDFSDDTSSDNEFNSIVNFTMDKRGSLYKRMGFGKLSALSEIFNMFDRLPDTKDKTPEDPYPEETNDNIVYMKLLRNDNNVFRNLSAFTGEKAYREYQQVYGGQNNMFTLLMLTKNKYTNTSTAWLYNCTLPELEYDEDGQITDEETIQISSQIYDLPVVFDWDRNLKNIETIEFFDKIYFTHNNKGLVCFDRSDNSFTYSGTGIEGHTNSAYKPSPMEVRKVGFNVLGDDPLYWVDYKGLSTNSIQGVYLTVENNKPVTIIPNGGIFRLNVLYTGNDSGFDITFKEGDVNLTASITDNASLSRTGLKVYDITFQTVPSSQVEIKISKKDANISDYYDYYDVGQVDPEIKPVVPLNVGECSMVEMYNRAVYYKEDTIWFSEINNFDYVPNYNYVSLPIEPTDKITKIIFFRNVYIVFTKQRIYKMMGAFGDSNFEIMPLNMGIGCHAPETVIPVENVLYFASPRGLYQLISSAAYSTSSMTFENVKEIDAKVKSLTADVTMYLGEKTDPSVRYNGISERAAAIRYKDKYMLFYNTAFEEGDIAALREVDVLVYQYELQSFSEIKFPIKPTFLFMVEGAIETFCTVPEKEAFTEEEVLLEYDFETDRGTNRIITDLSGNNRNANMIGGTLLAPGTGIIANGDNAYIKTGAISGSVDLASGFDVKVNCQVSEMNNAKIYELKQIRPTGKVNPQSFSLVTGHANGYYGELLFTTSPNADNMTDTIYWTMRWHRESYNQNASQNGMFWLKDMNTGAKLINDTNFSYNMGGLYQDVASGSFVVNHDSNGNYSRYWRFEAASYYPTYSTGWDNGPTQTFDVTQYASWSKYYGIRLVGRAEAFNGGCNIYYTPYVHLAKYGSLYNGSRNLYTWINGTQHTHTIGSISNDGNSVKEISGGEQSQSIGYTGQPTIGIDAQYNIKATIKSTYRENLDIDGFAFTLPYSNPYTITNWNWFNVSTGDVVITLNQILKPSYKAISLELTNNEHSLKLIANSEYGDWSRVITNNDISIAGQHNIYVTYRRQSSNFLISIYVDDVLFGTATTNNVNNILNSTRDNSILCSNLVGSISLFELKLTNGSTVMLYDFTDGKGTTITDKSGNKINGSIIGNLTWSTENGLKFDGTSGYLILPEFDSGVRFSNGYSIEFEARFEDIYRPCKIFDLATSYDSGSNSSLKCSINAGTPGNDSLDFMSTSISHKTYKLSKTSADLSTRHKWKFNIIDNGKNYDVYIYRDDELVNQTQYNYGGITNLLRKSNFIGKSNNPNDKLFSGMLYNFKIKINASSSPVPIYSGALYEYDTTYDDFGRKMELELETKGINLNYPQHQKKLKHIFVKGLGGFNYNNFEFEVYTDGHLVNDPRIFDCYIDEVTRQVVYDYTVQRALGFNEMVSLLGNMRLDNTKFGESTYETKKLVIPCKGKNFSIKIKGESDDHLGIESFGFTFKLGKVRDE